MITTTYTLESSEKNANVPRISGNIRPESAPRQGLPAWADPTRFSELEPGVYMRQSRRRGQWGASIIYDGIRRRIPIADNATGWGSVRRAIEDKTFAPRRAHKSGVVGITYEFLYARLDLARRRAAKAGRECDITVADLYELGDAQRWRCALTGIAFDCRRADPWSNPFTLSIDRIESGGGYTRDNIRLILYGMNCALGQWGEQSFEKIARAYVAKRKDTP